MPATEPSQTPSAEPGAPGQSELPPAQRNPFEEPEQPSQPTEQQPGETAQQTQPEQPTYTPAQQEINAARDLIAQGKYEDAIQRAEAAIKLKPEDKDLAVAYFYLGVANRMLQHYDAAIDAFTTSLRLNPDDPETFLRRGIVWFYKGEYGVAWSDFDEASAIIYDDPRPNFGKAFAWPGKENGWTP